MSATVIAIANRKGGVAKTTTAVNLGHGLARRGKRVLLVDLDSQGNLATCLGIPLAPGVYRFLVGQQESRDVIVGTGRERLALLPGNQQTAEAKVILAGANYREQVLAARLTPLKPAFDFILLDTAPSTDIITVMALVAADSLLVPVKAEYLSAEGLIQVVQELARLRQSGPGATLKWVVPTFYEDVTRESRRTLLQTVQVFGRLVTAPIRQDTRLREAPAQGQTTFEYAPAGRATQDYEALVRKVLSNGKGQK